MRSLLVVLPYEVIREERLARTRGAEHELVAVGDDAPLHRKIRDVQMQRDARHAVDHTDAERRERRTAGGLFAEEA